MKTLKWKDIYLFSILALILLYLWVFFYILPETLGQLSGLQHFEKFNRDASELVAENRTLAIENEKLKALSSSTDQTDFAENLLQFLSIQGNDIILEDLAGTAIYENEDSKFYMSSFKLSAPYTRTIQFLHLLEQQNEFGKVSSIHLQKKSLSKTDQKLIAEIICTSQQLK